MNASMLSVDAPVSLRGVHPADRDALLLSLCHWVRNVACIQETESHFAFHFGSPCPYQVVVEMLNGREDPRDLVAEWIVLLPFQDGKPPMSLNDRYGHWAVRDARVNQIKALVRQAVLAADVPHLDHVHVEMHVRPATNRLRDVDNMIATLKPAIDGLHQNDKRPRSVWAPIVDGDDPRYVSWSPPVLHRPDQRRGPATWLVLRGHNDPPRPEQLALT